MKICLKTFVVFLFRCPRKTSGNAGRFHVAMFTFKSQMIVPLQLVEMSTIAGSLAGCHSPCNREI